MSNMTGKYSGALAAEILDMLQRPDDGERFPITDGPSVPLEAMLDFDVTAYANHNLSIRALTDAGGLCASDAWCVVAGIRDDAYRADTKNNGLEWERFALRVNAQYELIFLLQEKNRRMLERLNPDAITHDGVPVGNGRDEIDRLRDALREVAGIASEAVTERKKENDEVNGEYASVILSPSKEQDSFYGYQTESSIELAFAKRFDSWAEWEVTRKRSYRVTLPFKADGLVSANAIARRAFKDGKLLLM